MAGKGVNKIIKILCIFILTEASENNVCSIAVVALTLLCLSKAGNDEHIDITGRTKVFHGPSLSGNYWNSSLILRHLPVIV